MPILNSEIRSYNIIFTGRKETLIQSLQENNLTQYIFLNDLLMALYVEPNFNENIFNNINQIVWWEKSYAMSSLINITNNLSQGVSVRQATDMAYMGNNLYSRLQGRGNVIAIIDSGIDYLNQDFINEDGSSKILYLWDQESDYKSPPEGMLFGSEFTRDEINEAISNNNGDLSKDEIGTGTIAAGIAVSEGKNNINYRGIAPKAELIVVKLRSYISLFKEGRINYQNTDFLVAISYIIEKFKEINRPIILNFTVGTTSGRDISQALLNTFEELYQSGFILVSGAGNQGNTDIHYSGNVSNGESVDIDFQVGDDKNLTIIIDGYKVDKFEIALISPFGEISPTISYAPNFTSYTGKFNLENVTYSISYSYPWISTGSMQVSINLENVYSGIWSLRVTGENVINGEFNAYLPNKNLISDNTRFIDSDSNATITRYGLLREVITVGTYNTKSNSMWIGSSKGPAETNDFILDIVAPGVDIISNYLDNTFNTATGSGVSSSVVCSVIALLIEFIINQTEFYRLSIYSEPIKTYLMLGATQKPIYTYPNTSYGYGILNYPNTLQRISENL
ncbi:MAG: bile acid germinant receptor pseudoprotease CspC [Intestinibacter bartlettii]|uniref:bile acid germinant receptor pseudoprotease CspC n=1 Tax=Intestinibacter bartlettii TaxID=261299 RepID=UPI0026EF8B56|nr:bile acid germinant receptor pseudoprotease CspC [Intestinibacter bartlettii]MDO5010853.1 bile acid germinant receptor pseudoprotease CspC [Intestinibacter bartlettii]